MAFPETPLPVTVDLLVAGAWTDITEHVYTRDPVSIKRGRANEGARVEESSCSLTLNNTDGRYSPRNPSSPYFGLIGRNTPIRVQALGGVHHLDLPGVTGHHASTPDHSSLDITGDIDIRADLYFQAFPPPATQVIASKYDTAGNQRSWLFAVGTTGTLFLNWSTNGTAVSAAGSAALIGNLRRGERTAVRATLDVDNGAGQHVARFYVGPTVAGPWTLVDTTTQAGTTSIFSSTAPARLGSIISSPMTGRIYAAQVRNGIDGTVVENPDFTAQPLGTTTFADSAGRTWTLEGGTTISDVGPRFTGEVAAWPQQWDQPGADVWTPVEAAGVMRRLGQGRAVVSSVLVPYLVATNPVAYWPLEDGPGTVAGVPAVGNAPFSLF
ncbi:MAG: hypothetical protein ACRDKW_17725, partial [Actinomycetota bacterium]